MFVSFYEVETDVKCLCNDKKGTDYRFFLSRRLIKLHRVYFSRTNKILFKQTKNNKLTSMALQKKWHQHTKHCEIEKIYK